MTDKGHLAHNDPAAEVLTRPNAPLRHKKKGKKEGKDKGICKKSSGSHYQFLRRSFKGAFLY